MSGRILILKVFKAHADLERQGLRQADGGGRLEILPGAIGVRSLVGLGRQGVQRTLVPLLVIALELEPQAHAIGPQVLVFIARGDSGKPLVERVAVAGQAEKEGVLMRRETHSPGAAPPLLGIVEELGHGGVEDGACRHYFEFHANLRWRRATQDMVAYLARRKLFFEARCQSVQNAWV